MKKTLYKLYIIFNEASNGNKNIVMYIINRIINRVVSIHRDKYLILSTITMLNENHKINTITCETKKGKDYLLGKLESLQIKIKVDDRVVDFISSSRQI